MKQVSSTITSNTKFIEYTVSGRPSFGSPSVRYHLICAKAPDIASKAKPGQFVTVSCGPDLILRRPLSIHLVDKSNQLYFLFAVVGRGTQWLSQRQNDETLDLLGPLGNGFSIEPTSKKMLLVAGGIGIAPLVFLAQKLVGEGRYVKMLLGASTKDGIYPLERLPSGIETEITTEDGSRGKKGMVSEAFPNYIDWADQIYACGPKAMYQTIASQMQQQHSKKSVQLSLEVRMGCGLGACFGCSIRTKHGMKQVCQDGPVFDLDELILSEVKI